MKAHHFSKEEGMLGMQQVCLAMVQEDSAEYTYCAYQLNGIHE